MKRFIPLILLLLPAVIFSFGASCTGTGEYIISAMIDGTAYSFTSGLTGIEENAFGELYTSSGGGLVILATEFNVASLASAANCFYFEIDSMSTSPASYTEADSKFCFIKLSGTHWYFDTMTLEITQFDSVGGVMKGTFSGIVDDYLTSPKTVSDGTFEVIRIPDSSF